MAKGLRGCGMDEGKDGERQWGWGRETRSSRKNKDEGRSIRRMTMRRTIGTIIKRQREEISEKGARQRRWGQWERPRRSRRRKMRIERERLYSLVYVWIVCIAYLLHRTACKSITACTTCWALNPYNRLAQFVPVDVHELVPTSHQFASRLWAIDL